MSSLASLFSTIARTTPQPPTEVCPQCHQTFTLGVTGTVDGCDKCTGITRATNGYALEETPCFCYEIIGDNPNCKRHP